ncbi:AAA family ATPase [Butyricicoccus sp.]|uniref:cytidylate kinase-like family protein n=1 Tax=Butyricicoccus sp. TaxID=2049021 RepID=UPI003F178022
MKANTIITISRQYGSQGREVGQELANRLGIPYYDRALITLAAKESGFSEELFDQLDRRATNSFLYSLTMFGSAGINGLSLTDQLYVTQRNIIRDLAAKGSCVFVGRCADYILRKEPEIYNFFIKASMEKRLEHAKDDPKVPDATKETLEKLDKQRAAYYNFYTGQIWGNAANYDMCLDSGVLGVSKVVDMMLEYIDIAQAQKD